MKKLLCLLLALVMVLSLAACADSDSGSKRSKKDKDEEEVVELEDAIVGAWTVDLTFTEEMLQLEGVNIDGIPMVFDFDKNGEVTVTFSDEATAILEDKLMVVMEDMVYSELEAGGMSRDEIDEMFETEYGMSLQEYMAEAVKEADFGSILDQMEETCDYEVDGDKLIMDGYEMTVEIKGNKLTITESEDGFWDEIYMELPVVMKRVK